MDELLILLFAANPSRDLRLDREIQSIEDRLRESAHRHRVKLIPALAARPRDLINRLSEHRPDVVHFSGHGLGGADAVDGTRNLHAATEAPEAQILLVDEATGAPKAIGQKALVNLFRIRRGRIRLIVLNACFTRPQAEALSAEVDCVIGTNRAIGDEAARVFSARLYQTLADGGSVQQAFDDARVELDVNGIPESATPALICRAGVDPTQVVLLGPVTSPPRRPGVKALLAAFWPRDRGQPADRTPVITTPPAKAHLSPEAVSRLGARLEEVRQSVERVHAMGSSTYLMLQIGQIHQRIQDGSEPESHLAQALNALSSRTDMMVSLQALERDVAGSGDSAGPEELIALVAKARAHLINDNVEAADSIRSQIERRLVQAGRPRRPPDPASNEQPRILRSDEDPRRAIPWLWDNGAVIRVAFLDGTPERREQILETAGEWTKYANLTFKVVDDPSLSDIRIATEPPQAQPGSFYSFLGTMAKQLPTTEPTVVLGITPEMSDVQMRRAILFQFGHVLGLIGEHTNPNCRGVLRFKDENEVISYYTEVYGWTPDMTRHLIFSEGFPPELAAYRACDPYSIMMYYLPPEVVENPPPELLELSEGDKSFVRRLYPRN
jgi:hypothetical protein